MSNPRTAPCIFISLLFLLLHVLVPAIALPVQSRPGFARSLDTPSLAQHDIALLKRSHATLLNSPLFSAGSSPDSVPVVPLTYGRVHARTFLDPHAIVNTPSLPQHGDTPTRYRVAQKLDRRSIFDKIREGFQNFGKKVKEGFQNAGKKIKEGFQNFGNKVKQGFQKVKTAFQTAGSKIKQGFQKVGKAFQTAGKKIKEGFQKFGSKVKQGFQKVKEGFQTAGRKIKEGFQTAGKKMKEGFQKAGKWIKENAGKAAKFGLKILSTAASVAGHVVSFIPGVGKIVGKGLSAVSKLAGFGSDKIHADLGDKLNKGMGVMDKISNPLGGVAGKVFDAILKRDMSSTWKKDT